MTALPQFPLVDDEEGTCELFEVNEDDWTAPAPPPARPPVRQFVLELPPWMVRQLEAQPRIQIQTPPAWAVDANAAVPPPEPERSKPRLVWTSAAVGCALLVIGLVAGTLAVSGSDAPIGVARRAPKALAQSIRAHDRITGTKAKVATVSIDSLARSHHRRHR
jgi:hypothetical protein